MAIHFALSEKLRSWQVALLDHGQIPRYFTYVRTYVGGYAYRTIEGSSSWPPPHLAGDTKWLVRLASILSAPASEASDACGIRKQVHGVVPGKIRSGGKVGVPGLKEGRGGKSKTLPPLQEFPCIPKGNSMYPLFFAQIFYFLFRH